MSKVRSSPLLYFLIICFIFSWWAFSFKTADSGIEINARPPGFTASSLFEDLSVLDRDVLRKALGGNVELMVKLIDVWDTDAHLLIEKGVAGIRTFSPDELTEIRLQATLRKHETEEKSRASPKRYLAQSYVAAAILLAVASPEDLTAIPRGLRFFPELYPPDVLSQIPCDAERMTGERLYRDPPDLAIVAPYSSPSTIEALRRQGIPISILRSGETPEEIRRSISELGMLTDHAREADLLALFFEACFISIDNRFSAFRQLYPVSENLVKVLCVNSRNSYTVSTDRRLPGRLIKRASEHSPGIVSKIPVHDYRGEIALDFESILREDPDCLVISIPGPLKDSSYRVPECFRELPAFRNKKIYFADDSLMQSPTQYAALAYFDLFQAFTSAQSL